MGGKVAQETDSIVHLSNLTGAEYFDAFVDMKDVSAVVGRQITRPATHSKGAAILCKPRADDLRGPKAFEDCQPSA